MKSPILIPFFECHFSYWVSFSDLHLVLPETEACYLHGHVVDYLQHGRVAFKAES
jgi:hypothetical protein